MKKLLVIFILLLFYSEILVCQVWKVRRYEFSAGLGTSQFYGDLGGYSKGKNILGLKDFSFKNTGLNISTSFKYRILDNVSVRLSLVMGSFHSSDARGVNTDRGMASTTTFFEPSVTGQYYFIKNSFENSFVAFKGKPGGFGSLLAKIDLYAFTGIGGLSYLVKPNSQLEPLVTKDKGFSCIIPVGLGVNYIYSGTISFGAEIGGRFTFSDNIDGYTSQYSKSNDVYHLLTFNFIYRILTGKNGLPTFH